ncbi:MAG: hypothetical protein PF574_01840 [Candidatus Delongbacteria bacterium]|nr:hypothetical protein [Candidatus Delongbacteria bacterium]
MRWSDNSNGEDGFVIDRYSNGDWLDNFAFIDENNESWIDSTITLNDSIRYRISAYRKNTRSLAPASQWLDSKIPAPGNFRHELLNMLTVKLSWIDNSNGEDGFRIERKISIDPWQLIQTLPADSTSWLDLDVPINENVQYRISAFAGTESSDLIETPIFENIFPAPSNLVLSQMNLNTIRLNWIDNSDGEVGFQIEKRDSLANWHNVAILGNNVETWVDSPTDIYDSLAYRVMAFKGLDFSDYSIATMNDIDFPPPSDLIVTRIGLTGFRLDWSDNSIGEDSFIIDRKVDDNDWVIGYRTVGADVETISPVGADLGSTCQFRIYAKAGSNYSNYLVSDAIFVTLEAPTNLTFTKLDVNSIRLNWTDNCDWEEGFMIDKFVNGSWVLNYGFVFENFTQWTDDSAEINKDIVYRVRTYDYDEIVYYYSAPLETGIIDNTFPAPSNLTADVSGMNITLNWDDNSIGEAGFKIDRKYNGDPWDLDFAQVGSDVVTWNETVADTGKYYYRMQGYLGTDESAGSEVTELWLQVDLNPPSNISYERVALDTISITWDDNSDNEDGFKIDKKVGESNWVENYSTLDSNITTWVDGSAEINQNLQYRIKSYKIQYYSSSVETGIIYNTIPTPANFTANISGMNITLNWTDSLNGEEGFKIDRKVGNSTWVDDYAAVGADIITWNETVVDTGKYYYRIKGYLGVDESAVSDVVVKHIDIITFMNIITDDYANIYDICTTTDGGYVGVGNKRIIDISKYWMFKTDSLGNIIWEQTYLSGGNGKSVQETTDGGYITTGSQDGEIILLKTDSLGNQEWVKEFTSDWLETGYNVKQTYDGGYAILCDVHAGIKIIKTDSSGDLVWDNTIIGATNYYLSGYSFEMTPTMGYVVVGTSIYNYGGGSNQLFIAKTDDRGDELWRMTYGASGKNYTGKSIKKTNDGNYIIAGSTDESGTSDGMLFKVSSEGSGMFYKTFGGLGGDSFNSVTINDNGEYSVVGSTTSIGYGESDAWLLNIDSDGNEINSKTYFSTNNETASCLDKTLDGGLIIGCKINSTTIGNIMLIKTDINGNVMGWEK